MIESSSRDVGMAVLNNLISGTRMLLSDYSSNKHGLQDTMVEVSELLAHESNTKSDSPARGVHVLGIGFSQVIANEVAEILLRAYVKANMVIPGNLSHGTITQLQRGDIAFLISKSGETEETLKACELVKNAGCICIGVTEHPESSLARICDKTLVLPPAAEAIPGSRMPTTSGINIAEAFMMMSGMITQINHSNYQTDGAHPGGTTENPNFEFPKSTLQNT